MRALGMAFAMPGEALVGECRRQPESRKVRANRP